MLENIVIAVFGLMLLSACFFIGLFVGVGSALDIIDADHQRENDLDSFERTTSLMETRSIIEVCLHDIAEIRTISVECGCETTQLVCAECGKELEPPKTEC
ncbi:hypothetical protein [Flavobacterium geliluteum]|uniref:Uncharacterized protein n=1 Tax=Flavobacterium geliluteum TaxID=2816120 RepID=A0A941B4X0_9FLAO|nr:hypothetical protein [Flavobacterium geliluteum]MBP4139978.1 hypothetical protein [Flavobacterium geliluteum]